MAQAGVCYSAGFTGIREKPQGLLAVCNKHSYTNHIFIAVLKVGLEPTFCFSQMYRQNNELLELLEPVVRGLGYELLGIDYVDRGRNSLLRIYIDNESGISLLDCEKVSVQVSGILDVNDPIRGSYNLEVSSPGFDRPLFTLEQFRRYIGHGVRLQLQEKIDGRRRISGVIRSVTDDSVEIIANGDSYQIDEKNIYKARLTEY